MSNRLIVFVKAPCPGFVKTRIAETVGAEKAYAIYEELVAHTLERVKEVSEVELRFSPDDAVSKISKWLCPNWVAKGQGSGGLGERLANAFEDAFQSGAKKVAIIGSDCPDITAEDVESAWADLENNDVVLGPAEDGGYWLIALKAANPLLFHRISWSSAAVLEETLKAAHDQGLRTQLLRKLSDVDSYEDWERYQKRRTLARRECTRVERGGRP